jgi:hypothetical protein
MLTHLYLSAHLDDAVLSCGGLIHKQVQARDRVVVVTICAGDPPPGELSPFAQELHQRWGLEAARAVAARRAEDLRALASLGAEAFHLPTPDCIYRADSAGRHLYASEQAIFGPLNSAEHVLARRVAEKISGLVHGLGRCHLYAPLGLGQQKTGEGQLASLTRTPDGRELVGEAVPLEDANLAAQGQAIAHYTSQISTFWANSAEMEAALREFALRAGEGRLAERLWRMR